MFSTIVWIAICVVTLLIGIIFGFFFKKNMYEKKIELIQKKFKVIAKEQAKKIFSALGKKPSEEQINRIIISTEEKQRKNIAKKKKNKKNKYAN